MIKLGNISFSYSPGRKVLSDISADFKPGTFHGIFGPNGSGKSSLLKIITGELKSDTGDISPVYSNNLERARNMAFVEQEIPGRVPLSVREVVKLGRYPWKREKDNGEMVKKAISALQLDKLTDKPYNKLSGGERQKVMLARALSQDTKILLLDEPSSSLDIAYSNLFYRLLRDLADNGKCVIMVSHDLFIAPRYLSSALLINNGKIVAHTDPRDALSVANIKQVFGHDLNHPVFA